MKKRKVYRQPKISSSKIKTISLYGRRSLRSAAQSEYLLAAYGS